MTPFRASLTLLILAGTAAFGAEAFLAAQAGAGALDGKMFAGEYGKTGKKAEGRDELIFKDGRFRSTACDPYKFSDAATRRLRMGTPSASKRKPRARSMDA